MVDLRHIAAELCRRTAWQQTPAELSEADYLAMVESALRHLFVITGRAALYDSEKMLREEGLPIFYDTILQLDEEEYLLIAAEIEFFRLVQTNVNNVFGYSTDALTVTNADKPYANLSATITELEQKRRILYYKMVRYNLL